MKTFDGEVLFLDRGDINTDEIIPAKYLSAVAKADLKSHCMEDLKLEGFDPKRDLAGKAAILSRGNFGCGSSREHAPWALLDCGFRCVIAPSFADIFYNNCFNNGLLPVTLPEAQVRALMAEARGGNHVFTVDLEAQVVTSASGEQFPFEIDPGRKEKLLKGLDAIGETLEYVRDIDSFEYKAGLARPWLEARA